MKMIFAPYALAGLVLAVSLAGCSTSNGMKAQVLGANIEIAKERAAAAAKPVLNATIPVPGCKAPAGEDWEKACVMTIIVHAPQGGSNNGQVAMPDDPAWRAAERLIGVVGTTAGIWAGGEAAVGLVRATSGGIVGALAQQPAPTVVMQPDPLVVTTPDPVVVTQPAPIIVEQPAPVIVEQPAPVIVEPVVVTAAP